MSKKKKKKAISHFYPIIVALKTTSYACMYVHTHIYFSGLTELSFLKINSADVLFLDLDMPLLRNHNTKTCLVKTWCNDGTYGKGH